MAEPDFNVRYIAELARIELTDEEASTFQDQLGKVIEYVNQLESIDVTDIEPTAHANPVYDVMRDDTTDDCLERERALRNAPRARLDQFSVTKVIE